MSLHSEPTTVNHAAEPLRVEFPLGLFGFPDSRHFELSGTPHTGFYWLQSLEHPALAFMLADPFLFFDEYAVELGDGDAAALHAACAAELAVLVTVTLTPGPGVPCTVNLQGPLVINTAHGRGRQIVLNQPGLNVREPLPALRAVAA